MIHSEQAVSLTVSHTGTFKWKLLASSYLTCNPHAFDTHPIHILYLITTPWLSQDLNALTLFFFFFLKTALGFPFTFLKNWRSVTLQCCVSAVQQHQSAVHIHISSLFLFLLPL